MIGALVALALSCAPAQAAEWGFRVGGIVVDETGADAVAARAAAQANGRRAAWDRFLAREAPEAAARLRRVAESDLDRLVEGFEVAEEEITTRRYRATLTVLFRPEAVRALFARELGPGETIEVRARVATPAEWAELRRRLAALPVVGGVELRSLGAGEARLALTVFGGAERAAPALARAGLVLASDGEVRSLGLAPLPEAGQRPAD
ncbi:MAG: hypothetical protein RML45_14945 [Acetobacteraceae bacterium]|nr:hypothetical protein [Acetobacteraceae bacterium]